MKTKTPNAKEARNVNGGSRCVQRVVSCRDFFAAMAMQARIVALGNHSHTGNTLAEAEDGVAQCKAETAQRAYQMADAMMAERAKAANDQEEPRRT